MTRFWDIWIAEIAAAGGAPTEFPCGVTTVEAPNVAAALTRVRAELAPFERMTMIRENTKVCLACKHPACPLCRTWCDQRLEDESGDFNEMCCGGKCTYEEKSK